MAREGVGMAHEAAGESRPHLGSVPFGQILLDDTFLLLFVGLAVPLLLYTVWGLIDIGSTPLPARPAPVAEAQPAMGAMPGMAAPAQVPAGAQRVEVGGREFSFEPAQLTMDAGRPVALTFANRGRIPHDWAVRDASGATVSGTMADAEPGEEGVVVFTLPAGAYEIVCTITGHALAGMRGRLIVR